MMSNLAFVALAAAAFDRDGKPRRDRGPAVTYRKKYGARRNDRCPCGSGRKFKRCCINAVEAVTAGPAPPQEGSDLCSSD